MRKGDKVTMNGATIIFYLLALLTLTSALLAVTARQIFRAAIYLLFALIGVAGIYFWMAYDFIAAVQIIVYVGGITVLIIFSIFLTQQAGELLPKQKMSRQVFAAAAVFCSFALVMLQVLKYRETPSSETPVQPTIAAIGEKMLATTEDGYALPFEVVSILLLAALIGCIVIAMRSNSLTTPQAKD